jgi:hypothetical protein
MDVTLPVLEMHTCMSGNNQNLPEEFTIVGSITKWAANREIRTVPVLMRLGPFLAILWFTTK